MEVDPELRLLSEGSGSARYWDARHRRLLTTHSFTEEDHAGAAGLENSGPRESELGGSLDREGGEFRFDFS